MDPKPGVMELEKARQDSLRHGDHEHQQKLTRSLLWKLDFQYYPPLSAH